MKTRPIFLVAFVAALLSGCEGQLSNQEAAILMDNSASVVWAHGKAHYRKLKEKGDPDAEKFGILFTAFMQAGNTFKFDLYMGSVNADKTAGVKFASKLADVHALTSDEGQLSLALLGLRGLLRRAKFTEKASLEEAEARLTRTTYTLDKLQE